MIIKKVSYFMFFAERWTFFNKIELETTRRQNVKWSLHFKTIQVINIIVTALLCVKVSLIKDAF